MKLKRARNLARLTQAELAGAAAVDHTTVAKLEADPDRYLTAHYRTIVNLARALGRDPLDIFPVPHVRRAAAPEEQTSV